jgi:hypothetical protein
LRTRRFEDAAGTAAAATTAAAHSAAGGSAGNIGTVPTDDPRDPLLARTDSDAALVGGGPALAMSDASASDISDTVAVADTAAVADGEEPLWAINWHVFSWRKRRFLLAN